MYGRYVDSDFTIEARALKVSVCLGINRGSKTELGIFRIGSDYYFMVLTIFLSKKIMKNVPYMVIKTKLLYHILCTFQTIFDVTLSALCVKFKSIPFILQKWDGIFPYLETTLNKLIYDSLAET